MGNGMTKVVDGLYLGNIRDSENKDSLSKNGITHILSVYNNAKPVLEDKTYLCIHAADSSGQNLYCYKRYYNLSAFELISMGIGGLQHFKECIRFIHESRLNGGGCLVHCLAGVSRSTTVVVAYLMTATNYSWEECLSAVKAVRSFVGPNFGFQQQLQEFQMTLVSEYRVWLWQSYSPNLFKDQEQVGELLRRHEEQQQKEQQKNGDQRWVNQATGIYPLPYNAYGSGSNS